MAAHRKGTSSCPESSHRIGCDGWIGGCQLVLGGFGVEGGSMAKNENQEEPGVSRGRPCSSLWLHLQCWVPCLGSAEGGERETEVQTL